MPERKTITKYASQCFGYGQGKHIDEKIKLNISTIDKSIKITPIKCAALLIQFHENIYQDWSVGRLSLHLFTHGIGRLSLSFYTYHIENRIY